MDNLMASPTPGAATAQTAVSRGLSHRQILTVLPGLLLGIFLAALDQTVMSTAIRTIGDDLNGLSIQAWVTTAFLVTATIATPVYGKLSDIYGRKPLFMIAIAVFIVGSVLCGLANSMYMLAGFRALQGVGAGGVLPLAFAIVGDLIPPRDRGRYQGYIVAVFGTASVLGPVTGGFFAGQPTILGISGWRWIFYINVPLGILALYVVLRVLKIDHRRRDQRIDWWGAASLVFALVPWLVIAEQGRTWGWQSGGAYGCYLLGAVGLVAFLRVEIRMGDEALLPLRMFRESMFSLGSAHSIIFGLGLYGGTFTFPLYLQIVKGASPTEAGLLMVPLALAQAFGSVLAGQVASRTGHYKIFPIAGSVLLVLGLALLAGVGADTPLWESALYMAIFGAGLGLSLQIVITAMQNAVDPRDMGVATSAVTFFRQIGGTLGTALFLSILFAQAATNIPHELSKSGVSLPPGSAFSVDDTSGLRSLPATLRNPIITGFSDAISFIFALGACILVIGLVLSIMLPEIPLRTHTGPQSSDQTIRAEPTPDPGLTNTFEDSGDASKTSIAGPLA
ncbi:MDR family MFS transporter [Pseudofrankia sp. BMG5.36]|uniref:MDR family MFS transporter n=1 Tax=Pseudofrankia sp. BMG5.36 TaxID=1834512 RepID=UPI001F5234EA|nr:MDR family MFS transporter [Pseudofrankia sp. BMG5.36]